MMFDTAVLEIQLVGNVASLNQQQATCNVYRGGAETLLRWMEAQLGLQTYRPTQAERISEYANALDRAADAVVTASLHTDRWGTARELLSRRD